jgi:Protein of unknown function (DUF4239)
MSESIFDLPLLVAGPAIVGSLCVYGIVGLWIVRRYILPRLRSQDSNSDFTGAMLQAVMVFYGLAVALIAVSVWQSYSDAAKVSSQEATAAAALYRYLGGYTEPARSQLQKELREYVNQIIHQAWPMQQRGQVPTEGVEMMNRFQAMLMSFEPTTEGQKILHAETLSTYNQLIQARRLRLDAVQVRLPGVLWFIIIVGALINLSLSFFFRIEDGWFQAIQVTFLAAFIGLVISLIFAFDRPFRGELGLRPDSYQLVYDHLMKP